MVKQLQTVRGRFVLLILCGLLGVIISVGVSLVQIEHVFSAANIGNENSVPSVIILDKAINNYGRLRTRIYRHVVSTDAQTMAKMDQQIEQSITLIRQAFQEYQNFISDSTDKKMLEEDEAAFAAYLEHTNPIVKLSRDNINEEAVKQLLSDSYAQYYEDLYAKLNAHIEYNNNLAKQATVLAKQEKSTALFFSILIFIIIAVCLILIGGFILRELKKQLGGEPQTVVEITNRISRGDLSSHIQVSQNDQTSMLASIASMQHHFKNLIEEISTIIGKAASGDFNYQMNLQNKQGFALEIGQKLNELNQTLLQQIGGNPEDGARVASAIAAGNLEVSIPVRSGDHRSMMYAMSIMSNTLKEIINEIQEMVNAATNGQFHHKIELNNRKGYAHHLGQLLNTLSDTTQEALSDIAHIAQTLSKGDLTKTIEKQYPGIFGESVEAINNTVHNLRHLVRSVIDSVNLIGSAASEIAAGNQDLSSRTEEQASSLEQTAASMEELTGVVRKNSENTTEANQLSQKAAGVATKGGDVVNASVETMREITTSSNRISEIISVIDGIAFQTNILALNAAVEAARAGELGKGFAVVANEVRSLSLRTTESAKQVKDLIQDSSVQVERGTEQAQRAGETMSEIVGAIDSVSRLISEISHASNEQRDGIEQVNKAIGQMDEVTQQNAALVEQVAAAAESLENQAQQLKQQVGTFRI